jgi:signal transduction histidine kinase
MRRSSQHKLSILLGWLQRAFDATATWVSQLSWWKFFLFAALALIAGSILQDELFSGSGQEVVVRAGARGKPKDSGSNIEISSDSIKFRLPNTGKRGADGRGGGPVEPAESPEPAAGIAAPAPPAPAAPPAKAARSARVAAASAALAGEEIHIDLPPQIGEQLSNAIEMAVEDAAEAKVTRYNRQASTWFNSFVSLLVLALFATKALVGGKKRAEAATVSANAAAERASMQRQLSETKMQMMQAQVEPHFLFNTLASVEYLIETDPPRASAMQRSLIQYLRAVLPQMRENAVITNLGREVDMVSAYLNLLKMRMEERLQVELRVPDALRGAAFPPMMLQSMVENAIKHGLECKPQGGTLKIVAEVAGAMLRVTVTDDGVGFGVMPSDGTGLGLPTIRERLKLLHGDQARLHISANAPCGVIACVEVPYEQSRPGQ